VWIHAPSCVLCGCLDVALKMWQGSIIGTRVECTKVATSSLIHDLFASHAGVSRNGGRPGAKRGPEVFRERLARTGCMINMELGVDLGYCCDLVLCAVLLFQSPIAHKRSIQKRACVCRWGVEGPPFPLLR